MVCGMTQPTEVILPSGERSQAIATLHALADTFVGDPVAPMPTEVELIRHGLTSYQLVAYAALYGQPIQSGTTAHWMTFPMTRRQLHGIDARLVLFGPTDLDTDSRTADERRAAYNEHNAALAKHIADEESDR